MRTVFSNDEMENIKKVYDYFLDKKNQKKILKEVLKMKLKSLLKILNSFQNIKIICDGKVIYSGYCQSYRGSGKLNVWLVKSCSDFSISVDYLVIYCKNDKTWKEQCEDIKNGEL